MITEAIDAAVAVRGRRVHGTTLPNEYAQHLKLAVWHREQDL